MVGLGRLSGDCESAATAVSADGSIVVGWSGNNSDTQAFIWDRAHGMRPLAELMSELGTDHSGWKLTWAVDVSADGTSIVGAGIGPDHMLANWIVNLAMRPKPASAIASSQGRPAILVALSVFQTAKEM